MSAGRPRGWEAKRRVQPRQCAASMAENCKHREEIGRRRLDGSFAAIVVFPHRLKAVIGCTRTASWLPSRIPPIAAAVNSRPASAPPAAIGLRTDVWATRCSLVHPNVLRPSHCHFPQVDEQLCKVLAERVNSLRGQGCLDFAGAVVVGGGGSRVIRSEAAGLAPENRRQAKGDRLWLAAKSAHGFEIARGRAAAASPWVTERA
jgi:hypothetical protein